MSSNLFYIKGPDTLEGDKFLELKKYALEHGGQIRILSNGVIAFYGTEGTAKHIKQLFSIDLVSTGQHSEYQSAVTPSESNDQPESYKELSDGSDESMLDASSNNQDSIIERIMPEASDASDQNTPQNNKAPNNNSDNDVNDEFRMFDKPQVNLESFFKQEIESSSGAIQDVEVAKADNAQKNSNQGPDKKSVTNIATETTEPIAPNVDPIAENDSFSVLENNVAVELWDDILSNDIDSDYIFIASLDTSETRGTIVFDTDTNSLTYETGSVYDSLAAGVTTTDTFDYVLEDARGGTGVGTVTIVITGVNDAPIAAADTVTITENATSTNLHSLLLSNDSDIDTGDVLDIISVDGSGLLGTLAFDNATNSIVYTANNLDSIAVGETATETFTYTLSDGQGGTDTQTVTITVNGRNDAPIARDDAVTIDEDHTLSGNVFSDNGSGADSDVDASDILSLVNSVDSDAKIVQDGTNGGSFTFDANGDFTFDPESSFQDLDTGETRTTSTTYTISDGNGGTDTATITVTVTGVNDAPIAVDDGYMGEIDEGGDTLIISEADLLSNDSDPDIEPIGIVSMSIDPSQGTITNNGNGTWTYTSAADSLPFSGMATITYTVSDGDETDAATFNVRVFNVLTGTTNDDTITSESLSTPHKFISLDGDDHVTGSDERDIFIASNGKNTFIGGAGDDDFIFEGTLTGENTVDGGGGADRILGSSGDDSFTLANFISISKIDLGAGNDTIYGTTGDDTYIFSSTTFSNVENLHGNGGNDEIHGTTANDTIDLRDVQNMTGFSRIDGLAGNDTIYGSQSTDHIYASAGQDYLHGSGGDDFFYVIGTENSNNADGYDGGDGYDTILGTDGDDDIAIDGTSYRGFSNIEEIDGGGGYNRILGDNAGSQVNDILDFSNVLLKNIDLIDGRSGNDTIHGSVGNDTIVIGVGIDTLYGEDGDDTFLFSGSSSGDDIVHGGNGNDIILGSDGDDTLVLTRLSGVEIIDGGLGTNIFRVGTADTIDLSGFTNGVDFLNFAYIKDSAGNETLHATAGDDIIHMYSDNGNDTFYGESGDDIFMIDGTQNGDDLIFGGDGYDSIIGSDNDDTMRVVTISDIEHIDLGLGTNIIIVDFNDTVDFSSFAAGDFLNVTQIRDDTASETIIGSQGNDTIRINADSSIDTFSGGLGDDTFIISGKQRAGDTVQGGDGYDSLIGSNGSDEMVFVELSSIEYIDLGNGPDTLRVTSGNTIDFSAFDATNFISVEFIADGSQAETIIGSQTNDTFSISSDGFEDSFYGGNGNDTFVINGHNQQNDIISGGNGTDSIIGTDDDDSLFLINVTDIESIDLGAGINYIYGANNSAFDLSSYAAGNIINVRIADRTAGVEVVTGTAGDDTFYLQSDTHQDTFNGGEGNDTFIIDGNNQQNDVISGGNGTDSIIGTAGDDTFYYVNVTSIETIDLGTGTNHIYGDTNATLDLSGFADGAVQNVILSDRAGNEIIYGTQGNDILSSVGDGANDVFYGEGGADTFIFDTVPTQSDTIGDFNSGEGDAIDISDLLSGYDELTDVISDFVQLTTSPTDSSQVILSIDIDGTYNGSDFVDIVTFSSNNQTLEDMITNGNIVI